MMAQCRNILIKYYCIFAIEGRAWVEAKKVVYTKAGKQTHRHPTSLGRQRTCPTSMQHKQCTDSYHVLQHELSTTEGGLGWVLTPVKMEAAARLWTQKWGSGIYPSRGTGEIAPSIPVLTKGLPKLRAGKALKT